jgi:hypothetical protein|tara:strand:+ start:11625 stop:11930 length:306 start_codon:yes stop_codon:yes gene_type:complete
MHNNEDQPSKASRARIDNAQCNEKIELGNQLQSNIRADQYLNYMKITSFPAFGLSEIPQSMDDCFIPETKSTQVQRMQTSNFTLLIELLQRMNFDTRLGIK